MPVGAQEAAGADMRRFTDTPVAPPKDTTARATIGPTVEDRVIEDRVIEDRVIEDRGQKFIAAVMADVALPDIALPDIQEKVAVTGTRTGREVVLKSTEPASSPWLS